MAKILVIEDEESIRENILDLLAVEEFESIGAENGLVGIYLAKSIVPDVIICDFKMPKLNGYDVLKALRRDPATAKTPFIFLSAKAEQDEMRQIMELEADDYLTKPCTTRELLDAIATQLEKQASQQKLNELYRCTNMKS